MSEVLDAPTTKRAAKRSTGNESSTNVEAAVTQHAFTGETCEIKLFKPEPGEPVQVFVQVNSYNAILHREKWVRVPVEVADHLESLMYNVLEPDPTDPDNRSKDAWTEKQRFPLQRRS